MLVIKLNRDVDSNTFWKALNDALTPRLSASTSQDGKKVLGSFGKFFAGAVLTKETEVRFMWREGHRLYASISHPPQAGQDADDIMTSVEYKSREFCDALLDVYVGKNGVSPSLIRDMESRV